MVTTANAEGRTSAPFWLRTGLMLVVALCVFVWGTGYKLSLYQPRQTEAPHAKLYTGATEAKRSSPGTAVKVHPQAQPADGLPLLALAATSPAAPLLAAQPPLPRHLLSHLFIAALFLRPPPAL